MKHRFIFLASLAGLAGFATLTDSLAVAAQSNSNFIASPAALKERLKTELSVTRPDFVVFVPTVTDTNVNDTGNEHFLVFDSPDGSLMAVWTQSSAESQPDQHIAFSRSTDEGKTWSKARIIAGPKKPGDGHMASWGYPLVSKSGRIYVLYSQHIGRVDNFPHHTGWLHGISSDDNGQTWSAPQNVPIARSIHDNPDPTMPPNMLCWQKPLRLGKDGKYFAGFTRWTSFAVKKNPTKSWISADSRVEFMRFENVDDNPTVADLKISWFAANEKSLAVPFPGHPEVSACQEPSVVKLPDGRLFCVMRTASGSPFWSVSADTGETWTQPRRLLRKDGGEPLQHPLSPCPMYDVGGNIAGSGRYALFIHNHDGHYQGYGPTDTGFHRRPVYLVAGRFQAGADQPVWFDEPKLFMDHQGVSLGKPGTSGRLDLALYSSFTVRAGRPVLWYPERKFFLLGRVIGEEWFGAATPAGPAFSDVFTAGEGGYKSIRIPAVIVSPKGAVLAFAEGRSERADQAANDIILKRSTDGGQSWGQLQLVAEDGAHSLNNPTAVVEQESGRVFLMYQRIPSHLKEASKVTATGYDGTNIYRNFLVWSDDDGATWTKPLDLTRSTKRPTRATTIASGPGIGIQLTRGLHRGRLIIPFNEGPYLQWNNFAVFSDDRGQTWKYGENVPRAFVPDAKLGQRSQINEVQMVELSDGSVRLNSRPFAGAKVRKTSVSRDGGMTWSPVEDVPALRDPSCNASILRYSFDDGADRGRVLFSGPESAKRDTGTVHLSLDDGATWPVKRVLWPGFFAYSVLTKLPDGTVGCLFEADNYGRIVFARFPLAWLGQRISNAPKAP